MLYYNSHLDCLPEQGYLKATRVRQTVRFGNSRISPFLGWQLEIIAILFLPRHTVSDGYRSLRFQVARLPFHLLECPFPNHFAAMPPCLFTPVFPIKKSASF